MNTAKSIVCTLFEQNYHFGVGALANSLYAHNFRGILYAGYRGPLPPWATDVRQEGSISRFTVAEGMEIHFALQDTQQMLANIKPELIEQVWEHYGKAVENVVYIDCDIVIKAEWHHFEEWAQYGVALCEDVNSPIARTHPIRAKWKRYFAQFDVHYTPQDDIYVNGGFVGVNRQYRGFARRWGEIQEYMTRHTGKQDRIGIADRWNMFHYMDQDALNVTKDLVDDVSIMGRDAMDFSRFGYVMSHAAGRIKPWHKSYIQDLLKTGARPAFTDKLYWQYVSGPIKLYPASYVKRQQRSVKIAALLGRFFTKT